MRILYHHRTQAEDGQAVHVRALIEAFEATGNEVFEVGLVPAGKEEPGRNGGRAGASRWGWVTRAPRFARELAEYAYGGLARNRILRAAVRFEPHFLYERYAFGNTGGVRAARHLGRPLVLEVNSPMVHELEHTRGLSFPRTARRVEEYVFRNADRICAVTGVLRDMLVELGAEPERVLVTPNGVDLSRYAEAGSTLARSQAREALGLPQEARKGELVLGFVGYVRPWHRLGVVLEAMRAPELAHARLVLVGEGPAQEGIAERAREYGMEERVRFAGWRPHGEIPRLLPAFDVALIPAINHYASPLKLFEYMAASLAIVAPDQENLREVLEPGVDALLVPPGEPEAMAQAVLDLAEDEGLRARLGAAARTKIVERDLTWEGNARRVVASVEELVR